MELQNTIRKEAVVSGIALHTGVRANLRILPAPENTGIVFRRIDMPGKPEVQAVAGNVIDVRRATTIASRTTGGFVVTVEHIMSSLHAAQVDNAIVEMDGPEPPIADCSAKYYFYTGDGEILDQEEHKSEYNAEDFEVFDAFVNSTSSHGFTFDFKDDADKAYNVQSYFYNVLGKVTDDDKETIADSLATDLLLTAEES